MTVQQMADRLSLTPISVCDTDRKIEGVFVGDLLSWVMGRARSENAWITIMSNVNIVAVASLVDVACVILAEGVTIDPSVQEKAQQKGVNIYSSTMNAYQLAISMAELLK